MRALIFIALCICYVYFLLWVRDRLIAAEIREMKRKGDMLRKLRGTTYDRDRRLR